MSKDDKQRGKKKAEPTLAEPVVYHVGDCAAIPLADDSVDLIVGSPPHEAQRTYGIGFDRRGDDWVDWAYLRYVECLRVCRGPVCWVIANTTRGGVSSLVAQRLMVLLADAGYGVRDPMTYMRYGMPNGGGASRMPRRITETIVLATRERRPPPWSDLHAAGRPAVCKAPGGAISGRKRDGSRVEGGRRVQPERAIMTDVIDCGAVGGGNLGHPLAHQNEAPYPIEVPRRLILAWCPPGGVVLDPFAGSGATGHAAVVSGRRAVLIDIRPSQIDLSRQRIDDVRSSMQGGAA